ncbi:MAG: carboxyltransferase domain-containing protein [Clostridia bacterium]|nr:carboxyltransferase domain-containing protein [Clostridia bacterium]
MGKYDVIISSLPASDCRKEIFFRQAGDGFLQVEYGKIPTVELMDSFRMLAVDAEIRKMDIPGLIETLPGVRTNLIHFDPLVTDYKGLISYLTEAENKIQSVDDMVIDSRIITLPMTFEDSKTKSAIKLYEKSVRKDAPNDMGGYNLEYTALCNGCTVQDIKDMVMGTYWYNSGCGFYPGNAFWWPMDPRCKICVPKANPPRTWTPEGAVGIGGVSLCTYPSDSGGGNQLFGRTIPVIQMKMVHPQYKESPFLYKRYGDRIRFREVEEDELNEICDMVNNGTGYEYEIEEGRIVVKDYLEFINSEEVKTGAADLVRRQQEASKIIPRV